MADIEDLKNKILHFKVIDLQTVLRHANSVKYGRKQDLVKRVFDILRRNPDSIRNKVREVYGEIYGRFSRIPCNDEYAFEHFANNARGSTAKSINPQSLIFMKSPFFAVLGRLMEPVVLAPSSRYSNVTEVRYWSFKLNLENANLLAQSRNTVRVHLKFCATDMSKRRDTFPYGLSVEVNRRHIPIPQNAAREGERKQQRYFVDITNAVRISPVVTNNIKIQWIREPAVYGAIIHLVSAKDPGDLVRTLAKEKVIPPLRTKAMIIQKLSPDSDGDDVISTTTLKASLICPLSKERITVPCRPASCTHLQCFDVHKFLKLNETKIFFTCPICHKSISFDELRVDSMFSDILSKAPDTCTEVEFHEDGRWSTGRNHKTGRKRTIEVIDLGSDDDDDVPTSAPLKKKIHEDLIKKSSVKEISQAKPSSIKSLERKDFGSVIKKCPVRNSSAHKSSLSKTKESFSHTPIIIQPHKTKSNTLHNNHEKKQKMLSRTGNIDQCSSLRPKKKPKVYYTVHSEKPTIASQQIPIDYSLPTKSFVAMQPKLPMIGKANMFTTNIVPQNIFKNKPGLPNMHSKRSFGNQVSVPKMVPIDLTISSKVLKSSANVLNLSAPVKHLADVRMPEAKLTSLKFNMAPGTSRHPNKYSYADTRNSSELKMQPLSTKCKKIQSIKHHLKYAPDVKIRKNTYMSNTSEHALGKDIPLSYPLRQHSGLVPALQHYAPMTSLSSIPSMVPSESVGFQTPKMFLPSKSDSSCLHSPIMQARCPPHMPFYPYNMQYYNQNPFGQFDFGNVFNDRVQGLPNIYSFLPSAIFPQNLHGITGDFLRKQAR